MAELLTVEQLEDWAAYYRLEPFGHRIDHSMLAQLLAAQVTTPDGRTINYRDFLFSVQREEDDDENSDQWLDPSDPAHGELIAPGLAQYLQTLT